MANLQYQLKALQQALIKGKVKNKHALQNKIKSLQKQLIKQQQQSNFYNWLAQ